MLERKREEQINKIKRLEKDIKDLEKDLEEIREEYIYTERDLQSEKDFLQSNSKIIGELLNECERVRPVGMAGKARRQTRRAMGQSC